MGAKRKQVNHLALKSGEGRWFDPSLLFVTACVSLVAWDEHCSSVGRASLIVLRWAIVEVVSSISDKDESQVQFLDRLPCSVSSAGERRFYTARVGSSILSPSTSLDGEYSVVVCTSVCEAESTSSILVTYPKFGAISKWYTSPLSTGNHGIDTRWHRQFC